MQQYMKVATEDDAIALAKKLRQEDIDEVKANSNLSPEEALVIGIKNSELPIGIYYNDECVSIFGVVPVYKSALIWLLASEDAFKYLKIPFLRNNKELVNFLNKKHTVLYNFVDARNKVHIKWLKWLGFIFINKIEKFGFEQRPFYEFVRLNNV